MKLVWRPRGRCRSSCSTIVGMVDGCFLVCFLVAAVHRSCLAFYERMAVFVFVGLGILLLQIGFFFGKHSLFQHHIWLS